MKNLISTLFLGGALAIGGCGEKKEKLVSSQITEGDLFPKKSELEIYNEENKQVYEDFREFIKGQKFHKTLLIYIEDGKKIKDTLEYFDYSKTIGDTIYYFQWGVIDDVDDSGNYHRGNRENLFTKEEIVGKEDELRIFSDRGLDGLNGKDLYKKFPEKERIVKGYIKNKEDEIMESLQKAPLKAARIYTSNLKKIMHNEKYRNY